MKQAAVDAIHANHNQYTRPGGQLDYVCVLADMYSPLLQRELDPMTNIVTFNGAQEGIASIMAGLLEPVGTLEVEAEEQETRRWLLTYAAGASAGRRGGDVRAVL